MPQREFWTEAHPTRIVFTMHAGLADSDGQPQGTVKVEDQAGKLMEWSGMSLPEGFASWAFADACRAACEAWELGTPKDVTRAFRRCCAQWKRDAKALLQT